MSVFPLTCSAFEQYMLCDDRPAYPATAIMELDVTGPIDAARLQQAFEEILPRHPLLTARVERRRFHRPRWVEGDQLPPFDIAPLGTPLPPVETELQRLDQEVGTRVFIRHAADRATLTLQVHHACSDAVGKLAVFADWLARYVQLGGAPQVQELPDPHLERLKIRGVPRRPTRRPPSTRSWGPAAKQAARFFSSKPVPLVGEAPNPGHPAIASPAFVCEEVPEEEFRELRSACKTAGLTLNDFLLTAMFATLREWSQEHRERGDPLFRVLVPFNMRLDEELYDSASNRIGYRFLMRKRSESEDWREVSRDVQEIMERIRTQRTSDFVRFLTLLGSCTPLSLLLQQKARQEQTVFATVVLSNFGDAARMYQNRFPIEDGRWRVGPLTVEAIRACPPKRPQTNVCIVAHGYANRLHLVTRGDGRGLSADASRQFLSHFRLSLIHLARQIQPQSSSAQSVQTTELGRS